MPEEVRVLAPGSGAGEVLVLDEPLSLWGGMDPARGELVDPRHPQTGASLAGRVLAMEGGRGSSSSSSVLAEAIRTGVAPAAIVLAEPDAVLPIGSLVAADLYGIALPIVVVAAATFASLRTGDRVEVVAHEDGRASVTALG